jgi:hypothetical protein
VDLLARFDLGFESRIADGMLCPIELASLSRQRASR